MDAEVKELQSSFAGKTTKDKPDGAHGCVVLFTLHTLLCIFRINNARLYPRLSDGKQFYHLPSSKLQLQHQLSSPMA
jgi:hypothetical protein